MGELIRTHDWSLTSLGTPDQWPQSLRTTLSILLNSKFPMFLWWGPDLIQFYNDAYRPSLGQGGKHPSALGQRGEDCWQETWPIIKPLIDQVFAGGEATWHEDQLIPIFRNGKLEDVYWTFSYSPVYDESEEPAGVFVTCTETTEKIVQLHQLHQLAENNNTLRLDAQAAQQLAELATENAGIGIFYVNVANGQTEYSAAFAYVMTGNAQLENSTWKQLVRYIHPDDKSLWVSSIQSIYEKGEFSYEPSVIWEDGSVHRVQIRGKMIYDETSQPVAYSGTARDVTEQRLQAQALARSEAKFRSLIKEAPVATCLFVGRELIIEVANEIMLSLWGKDESILGKPLVKAVPELIDQPFLGVLDEIFTTGKSYEAKAALARIERDGVLDDYYFDFTYKPLVNANGEVYAIMDMAVDVTEQVIARRALEESELFSRSVIDHSPIAKVVFVGENMLIKTVNQNMLAMLGRDASIVGMAFMEAIPELRSTSLLDRLQRVYTTGETFYQSEEKIELIKYGQPHIGYYNYIYKALWNTTGEIYGIIVTATEVTEQVVARQKIEEAEATLRSAIELADLGTWQINLDTQILDYSPRLRQWNGIGSNEIITVERAYQAIRSEDHERIRTAIFQATTSGTDGIYDVEYTLNAAYAGKERILRAQGLAFFNAQGRAYKISGTVQDVTVQRQIQSALEQQVQERTEEIEATNEELAATNEELATTNDELANSVHDLQRSNENLQQFAYIASHDLQEPLRKIQSFGDILKTQYGQQLGEGADYLQRMQAAAGRMSTLIKDLLTFSRISTRQETAVLVSLNQVVQAVLIDLDLTIQETNAVITVNALPIVQGDPTQLGQLFQNLFSNALKFRRADVEPLIQITAHPVAATDLPLSMKPNRIATNYSRVDVRDNGIGFDQKYVDRIFQVFQRLHNKSQYAGTGIGLAICEKVAANHGGAISAYSQAGKGSTFSVYLPVG